MYCTLALSNKTSSVLETATADDIVNRLVTCDSASSHRISVDSNDYVLPPRCRFLFSDVTRMRALTHDSTKYNVIVIDPPWENKSVKRKKTYGVNICNNSLTWFVRYCV